MLKIMHKLNKYFTILNKYLFILPIVSLIIDILSKVKTAPIFKVLKTFIKILIYINIILGVGLIVYFTDFTTPLNTTYSLYLDLLDPYIEIISNFYTKLINYFKDLININYNFPKVSDTDSIQSQVKDGIKSGIKEALDEVMNDIEADSQYQTHYYYKQIAIFGSTLFLCYFIFILPGSTITPEELTQYNWLNQGLIDIKLSIINLFNAPPGPDAPGAPNSPIIPGSPESNSTIRPNTPGFDHYF